jgi:V8-like Glu-specific endopeptidase
MLDLNWELIDVRQPVKHTEFNAKAAVRRWIGLLLFSVTGAATAHELSVLPLAEHETWQAVGRINTSGFRKREMCSAVLIAPDQVLTAAHCLTGTDGSGLHPENFTFVAGWLRGQAVDSVSGASIWVHPKAYARGVLDIHYDIAVLSLERASSVEPLPIATGTSDAPFGVLGYSTRRPHMLSASFACDGSTVSDLLLLGCEVLPGNSGGPVLTRTPTGWAITAIVSAMGPDGALAVPVSRLTGAYPPTM